MSGRLEKAMAEEFGSWLHRMHGVTSSCDHGPEARGLSATVLALLDSPEAREEVAEVLEHEHWCESNYTKGCNCADARNGEATAALAALREWLGGES